VSEQWAEVLRLWSEKGREGSPWRAGMLSDDKTGDRPDYRCVWDPRGFVSVGRCGRGEPCDNEQATIDPTDPATRGCLLELVREVWDDGGAIMRRKVRRGGVSWWALWFDQDEGRMVSSREHPTEGEALLAALIAGLKR
jgi:hypothetical protein